MPAARRQYEVVSVSLPCDLVRRANAVIPKARRSRVITHMLISFLGSIERQQMERAYESYYAHRSGREATEERDLLADWKIADDEAWAILRKTIQMADVRRGGVVIVNLDPTIGVEIKKTRPAIVVSNDSINRFSQLVVVVPLTKNTAHLSPSHMVIPKGTATSNLPIESRDRADKSRRQTTHR